MERVDRQMETINNHETDKLDMEMENEFYNENDSGARNRRHSDANKDEDQIEKDIKEVREAALRRFLIADKFVSGLLAFIVQFRKVQVESSAMQ